LDTDDYRRVGAVLKYVACGNSPSSLHVHVGIRGIDRAVRVCDRFREVLPLLLAISANSPYLDGRDSGLHSARTQSFTRNFPRCGIPDAFGGWRSYREYIEFLVRTHSIVEFTQVWWSVRPHFEFGTVEVRICDAQSTAGDLSFPERNGAQRQRRLIEAGASPEEVFAASVRETLQTYSEEVTV